MATAGLDDLGHHLAHAELGAFNPRPYHEKHTDALIFYARNERSYGKRLNENLTLFLSLKDKSLVGIEIKGIKRLEQLAKDSFFVQDKGVPLSIYVSFARVSQPDDPSLEERYLPELKRVTENVFVS